MRRLQAAVNAYTLAMLERTQGRAPLDWTMSLGNRTAARSLIADRRDDLDLAASALTDLELAEGVMRAGGHISAAGYCAQQITITRAAIACLYPFPR